MSHYTILCLEIISLSILLNKVRANETDVLPLPFDEVSTEWWNQHKYKHVGKEFPNDIVTTMLQHLEENMAFYEKNGWSLDVRAGLSVFLIKLNLKVALRNKHKMYKFDNNAYHPIKSQRLQNIAVKANRLGSFLRSRVLARVPRLNMTRQVAALYVFTEIPWFEFVPSLAHVHMDLETMALEKTLKIKQKLKEYKPWPTDYNLDLIMNTKEAKTAQEIVLECLEVVSMNIVQEKEINKAKKMHNKTSIPSYKCQFPTKEIARKCLTFIHHGKPDEKAYGHTNFYRIALITAAKFARNCFFISAESDGKILNYLCYMAMVQVSKFQDVQQESTYYTTADPLTVMDLANICLLNGKKNFLLNVTIEPCNSSELVWNEIGCYGPQGYELKKAQPKPLPLWVVVANGNIHENGFCNRRMTYSCLAYFSSVIRAIVEIGYIRIQALTTPVGGPTTVTPSTEWLPLRR